VDFVKEIGVRLSFADVDFSLSRHEGLRVYERGFVKEGVGAGGSMIMALSRGVSPRDIVNSVDDLYSKLTQI
jgi:NaMN:DMB phosphoribosyltransferase